MTKSKNLRFNRTFLFSVKLYKILVWQPIPIKIKSYVLGLKISLAILPCFAFSAMRLSRDLKACLQSLNSTFFIARSAQREQKSTDRENKMSKLFFSTWKFIIKVFTRCVRALKCEITHQIKFKIYWKWKKYITAYCHLLQIIKVTYFFVRRISKINIFSNCENVSTISFK